MYDLINRRQQVSVDELFSPTSLRSWVFNPSQNINPYFCSLGFLEVQNSWDDLLFTLLAISTPLPFHKAKKLRLLLLNFPIRFHYRKHALKNYLVPNWSLSKDFKFINAPFISYAWEVEENLLIGSTFLSLAAVWSPVSKVVGFIYFLLMLSGFLAKQLS